MCSATGASEKMFRRALKKHKEKAAFAEELQSSLYRNFACKCEWEVVIAPWPRERDTENIKVDVYQQVMNNWGGFLDYVWDARRNK